VRSRDVEVMYGVPREITVLHDVRCRIDIEREAEGALPRVQLKLFIQAIQISGF
jgi:hypothetical protein